MVLREVFRLPTYGGMLTFKGGTSLSKAWGLIDRFSEDVDLTVDQEALGFSPAMRPENAKSKKQGKEGVKRLRKECRRVIQEQIAPALRRKLAGVLQGVGRWELVLDEEDPDGQTLNFRYPDST